MSIGKEQFFHGRLLISVPSIEEARKMVHNVTKLLVNRELNLGNGWRTRQEF